MKTNRFLSLAAFFAITFTFSCSSDDPSPPPSVETSSNSSGENQMVYCKLTAGTCSQMSLSTCMELVNAGAAQIVSNCTTEEPPPPQSSSSNSVTIIGYCDYGPIQPNGDGGCFPMATADDEANCAMWGKVVSSCGATTPSSNSVPSSSSNSTTLTSSSSVASSSSNSTTLSSSSSKPSSSSVSILGYCDYGPITEYGGGCFAMATAADKANCELPANGGKVVTSCPSSSSIAQNTSCLNGTFTDSRDNQTYKCVKIGTQTWMAQNLNYCPAGSKCYFVKDKRDTYGYLYDREDAMVSCPSGWHLPSYDEFGVLIDYVQLASSLKATSGWNSNGNGTNSSGFSALPGGRAEGTRSNVSLINVGSDGFWWSSSETGLENLSYYVMTLGSQNRLGFLTDKPFVDKNNYCSVRCIQ